MIEKQKVIQAISIELFGTPDYESVLDMLSPSDSLIKEFKRRVVQAFNT